MASLKNDRGSILVFATLMIVLLLILVGMGLDTGHLSYVRSQGQPAVDAAALAGASAIPTGAVDQVYSRVAAYNAKNDYVSIGSNQISASNVTLINWDDATGTITKVTNIADANGVRVGLEQANPYGGSPNAAIQSPLFLTPLLNLFGSNAPGTANVNVSAVAVMAGIPAMPIALGGCPPPDACESTGTDSWGRRTGTNCKLIQTPSTTDVSGFTTFLKSSANAKQIKAMVGDPGKCGGNIPWVFINDCINLNNGSLTTVLDEFYDYYSSNPGGLVGDSGAPPKEDCGLVPVIDEGIQFNQCSPVRSFAKLCIRNVVKTGSPKYVYGDLTCYPPTNAILYDPTVTSCYLPRLVRDTKSGM